MESINCTCGNTLPFRLFIECEKIIKREYISQKNLEEVKPETLHYVVDDDNINFNTLFEALNIPKTRICCRSTLLCHHSNIESIRNIN